MFKKVKIWVKDHNDIIGTVIAASCLCGALIVVRSAIDTLKEECMDEYVPLRLYDKNGAEYRFFKWDTGYNNDPLDMIFYPAEQVEKAVDWDAI